MTEWRALQAAPRRRDRCDGSGGIRTLSISRSKREWSACCLPSQNSGGWNRTSGLRVQSAASLPPATAPEFGKEDSNLHRLIQSQGAYPLADSRERHARVELAYPVWKTSAWTARPMTRSDSEAEGEGVEPSRLVARPGSGRVPSPVGLPFRVESGWLDLNQRGPASGAGG